MPNVLITGSNRGLGLEWVRQYAEEGWRVFATCRHPAEAQSLRELSGQHPEVSIHRLDVTVVEDIRGLFWELEGIPVDVLLGNAGVYLEKNVAEFGSLCYHDWLRTLEVNTMGTVRVAERFLENIAQSQKRLIVAVSSHMGSIADIQDPGSYYYRSSKAALNAVMEGLAVKLKPRGIGVLILHPGGVRTRMGPPHGISARESVRGMRRIVQDFQLERDTGRFVKYDLAPMPW
ncbi:MAG: SDR family oxidoreductase [Deltaproteobacteria bacterium]|nr:SDR family oxidoreductase [Deltaproteobacteria bacterium]